MLSGPLNRNWQQRRGVSKERKWITPLMVCWLSWDHSQLWLLTFKTHWHLTQKHFCFFRGFSSFSPFQKPIQITDCKFNSWSSRSMFFFSPKFRLFLHANWRSNWWKSCKLNSNIKSWHSFSCIGGGCNQATGTVILDKTARNLLVIFSCILNRLKFAHGQTPHARVAYFSCLMWIKIVRM